MPRPRLSTLAWLLAYFSLNLTLTLYNKLVLNRFPFPYTLTALHALCSTAGSYALLYGPRVYAHLRRFVRSVLSVLSGRIGIGRRRTYRTQGMGLGFNPELVERRDPPVLARPKTLREHAPLLLFSTLYTLNIVLSNASLRLVTVPFHQCVRASAPVFVLVIQFLFSSFIPSSSPSTSSSTSSSTTPQNSTRRIHLTRKHLALLPVILGVALATYGDYYFTWPGFALTLAGTALAALKTVATAVLVGGERSRMGVRVGYDVDKREGGGELTERENSGKEIETHPSVYAPPAPYAASDVIYSTPYPRPLRSPISPSNYAGGYYHHADAYTPHPTHDTTHETRHPDKIKKDEEDEETRLYPPHALSPTSAVPFRFPSPCPSPSPYPFSHSPFNPSNVSHHTPIPVEETSSTSSTGSSGFDGQPRKTRRPLSYSAFNPGQVDDCAPSIPVPFFSTGGVGGCTMSAGAERKTKVQRPSPRSPAHPAFIRHPGRYGRCGGGEGGEDGYEGECEDGVDDRGQNASNSRGWSREKGDTTRAWKTHTHAASPSQAFVSALDGAKRRLRVGLRVSSVSSSLPSFLYRLRVALTSLPSFPSLPTLKPLSFLTLPKFQPLFTSPRNLTPAITTIRKPYTPLHLLALLSPLAFIQCVALASWTGELERVGVYLSGCDLGGCSASFVGSSPLSGGTGAGVGSIGDNVMGGESGIKGGTGATGNRTRTLLLLNGLLAFALNVASFGANRRVGAVGMSVAGNTKQALTVLLSIALFDLALSRANAVGVGMALLGGGVYAWPG